MLLRRLPLVVLLWCQLLSWDIPVVGANAGRPIRLPSIRNRTVSPFALRDRRGGRLGERKRRWRRRRRVAPVHIHRVYVTSVVVLVSRRGSRGAVPGSRVAASPPAAAAALLLLLRIRPRVLRGIVRNIIIIVVAVVAELFL